MEHKETYKGFKITNTGNSDGFVVVSEDPKYFTDKVQHTVGYRHCGCHSKLEHAKETVDEIIETRLIPGNIRKNIKVGSEVEVELKEHRGTGELTSGIVGDILTSGSDHPHGILVQLESGEVGRVKWVGNTNKAVLPIINSIPATEMISFKTNQHNDYDYQKKRLPELKRVKEGFMSQARLTQFEIDRIEKLKV